MKVVTSCTNERASKPIKSSRAYIDVHGTMDESREERNLVTTPTCSTLPAIQDMRDAVDDIDAALIHLLAERFLCTRTIGALKARHRLPPVDPARERQQVTRLRALAEAAGLDPDFAEDILKFITREVVQQHKAALR